MHYRGIAGMKPAAAHGLFSRRRVVVITSHHDVAANDNLTRRLAIVWDLHAVFIDDFGFARGNQLDALSGLDGCAFGNVEAGVFSPWFTHGDERRGFSGPISLRDDPFEFIFQPLDR